MEEIKQDFLKAYDENADSLFRYCFFKVHDREKSKDILQDTFTKTWSYISRGNEVSNMKAFLYKTLNNLIIDDYRKKKGVSLDAMQEEGFDPHFEEPGSVEERIDGEKAILLLRELPEHYREAIFMRFVNNLELKEIASVTGESENTISVHIHRGLKKLKELYENGRI